jgi:GTP-binding protein
VISGGYIENMMRGVNLEDPESFAYFHKRLKQDGVIEKMLEKGLKKGTIIFINDKLNNKEFEWEE